jgi:molybdate transport system substrate-binding protein
VEEKMNLEKIILAVIVMTFGLSNVTPAQDLRVAAASDLSFAMQDLTAQFEKQTGHKVEVAYGSSGNFYSQLQNGAPFDLFFSADIDYPRKLDAAGLTEPGTLLQYATGQIVIWMPADAKVDLAKQGWNALLDASVQKIAIANPEHAPYGRAAVAALQKAGIYEQLKSKLVFGENISQAAQFVQSGSAQAGIIAMSLAVSPAMQSGKRWQIPPDQYPAIDQGAVVMTTAKNKNLALDFLRFVRSDIGRTTLAKYGFALPPPEKSAH